MIYGFMKYLTAMLSKSYKIVETIKYVKPLIFQGLRELFLEIEDYYRIT